MRILYTHRTQGVGAEGAHILGMFEAFAELGNDIRMHCLPGCDPVAREAAAKAPGNAHVTQAASVPGNTQVTPAGKPKPSLIKRAYWFIAEHAPESIFEVLEILYNIPLFVSISIRYFRFRPEMIYERYALNTFAPSLLCKLTGCRHVLEVNDSMVIERSRPLAFAKLAGFWESYCLSSAGISVTITQHFKDLLTARFGVRPDRMLVLPNAVSGKRFSRGFDREAIRRNLGLKNQRIIGASGQFLPWHGLMELLDKMGPLAQARDLFFLFIGDGPVKEAVLEKAKLLGISDRVRFTGMIPITQVGEYLSALDMAVIPTAAKHASPMKLMEYMALGLPIVAPDLPSIRAALPDETMGAIFPAGDMDGMKASILGLLERPEEAANKGRQARAHVLGELTWTRHAEKVLDSLACIS